MIGDERPVTLDDAYAVVTPQDSRRLYARWAATYDSDFVRTTGYVVPDAVADVFADVAGNLSGPVLDVGCGTGLVAVALVRDTAGEGVEWVLDGVDISPDMLAVASTRLRPSGRALYRNLIEADVTNDAHLVPLRAEGYAGVLSAGTFTHGHLGPDALTSVIALGRSGAIFAIGINADHFESRGFGECLSAELDAGTIRNLDPRIVDIYRPGSEHEGSRAIVAVFRRS